MTENSAGTPATIAYAELVEEHLEPIFKSMVLLLGERDVAEAQTLAAFQRIWEDLNQGNVFGDATEILYRAAARGALTRLRRSRELRGHLPPTTADDRLITAMGIIGDFEPQQRAAIMLSALCGAGYGLAGIATGVGAGRARDLAFAARQEYRNERGATPDRTPDCGEIATLLSRQADGDTSSDDDARIASHVATCPVCTETTALYGEFARLLNGMRLPQLSEPFQEQVRQVPQARGRGRPEGWRRVLRLALGPAVLVVILFGGLFVFRAFGGGEPSMKTGDGRTSDILYTREAGGGGLLILESGSGRRLGRLPGGTLTADGRHAYFSASSCPTSGCTTTVSLADTATLETTEVARVPGRFAIVAVDDANNRVYLADEEANWGRLVIYDVAARQTRETLPAPPGVDAAFRPSEAKLSSDERWLLTVGSARAQAVVVQTDVRTPRVVGTAVVGALGDGGLELVPPDDGGRVLAYENGTGRLHEVDPAGGSVVRTLDLSGRAAVDNTPPGGDQPEGTVAADGAGLLYAVVRTGGIAVVDRSRFEVARRLNADRDYATVAVSSDGRQLYVVDRAGAYAVLDAATGNQLLRRPDVQAAGALQVDRGE